MHCAHRRSAHPCQYGCAPCPCLKRRHLRPRRRCRCRRGPCGRRRARQRRRPPNCRRLRPMTPRLQLKRPWLRPRDRPRPRRRPRPLNPPGSPATCSPRRNAWPARPTGHCMTWRMRAPPDHGRTGPQMGAFRRGGRRHPHCRSRRRHARQLYGWGQRRHLPQDGRRPRALPCQRQCRRYRHRHPRQHRTCGQPLGRLGLLPDRGELDASLSLAMLCATLSCATAFPRCPCASRMRRNAYTTRPRAAMPRSRRSPPAVIRAAAGRDRAAPAR